MDSFFLRPVVLCLLTLCLASCSDDGKTSKDPEPSDLTPTEKAVDCAWLEQNQCWKQAVQSLSSCRDSKRAHGRLTSNQDSCILDDGTLIRFQQPLPTQETSPDTPLEFDASFERAGRSCGQIKVALRGAILTTGAGVVKMETTEIGLRVTCGKESMVMTEASLRGCNTAHIPAVRERRMADLLTVTLEGAGEPQAPLFSCGR